MGKQSPSTKLVKYLARVCRTVDRMFVIGSRNIFSDRERTAGFVVEAVDRVRFFGSYVKCAASDNNRAVYCYVKNKEAAIRMDKTAQAISFAITTEQDPLRNMDASHQYLLLVAILSLHYRAGNCAEKSKAIAYFLWKQKHPNIQRIEIFSFREIDHDFVVINRDISTKINFPSAWNQDAIIVDLWASKNSIYHVYPASVFHPNMTTMLCENNLRRYYGRFADNASEQRVACTYAINLATDILPETFDLQQYFIADIVSDPDRQLRLDRALVDAHKNHEACVEELKSLFKISGLKRK